MSRKSLQRGALTPRAQADAPQGRPAPADA